MKNTTIIKEYAPAGMKMYTDEDVKNKTTYYWKPEMGFIVAENTIGDIAMVYKTKETLSDDIDKVLSFIEEHAEDGVISINFFYSITEARAFVKKFFDSLAGK